MTVSGEMTLFVTVEKWTLSLREEQTLHQRLSGYGHQVCASFQVARLEICVPMLVTTTAYRCPCINYQIKGGQAHKFTGMGSV